MPRQHSTERRATITIDKEYLKFSAAHFTIFSATERERLHGHNFSVSAVITAHVGDNGMASNYRVYKELLQEACDRLDEYMLLPGESPHISIEEDDENYRVLFNAEVMTFIKADTLVLPIRNTTVEEFSHYLLGQFLCTDLLNDDDSISALEVRVESGPGQMGASQWQRIDL